MIKKWGNYDGTYVLLKNSNVVFMYSHMVQATKFFMTLKNYRVQGNDFVYELPKDVRCWLKVNTCNLEEQLIFHFG
jgi:hypothetical protein